MVNSPMERKTLKVIALFIHIFATLKWVETAEATCGLGNSNDYSQWIADQYGRLSFPIYNKEIFEVGDTVEFKEICSDTLRNRISHGYDEVKNGTCQFNDTTKKAVCEGGYDDVFLKKLHEIEVETLVLANYYENIPNMSYRKLDTSIAPTQLRNDNTYKLSGQIYSHNFGSRIQISVDIAHNLTNDKYLLTGDAFSNELRVGWEIEGELNLDFINNFVVALQVNISSDDSSWTLIADLNHVNIYEGNDWIWKINGSLSTDFFVNLNFEGNLSSHYSYPNGWSASGETNVKPVLLDCTVDGTVTTTTQETITIKSKFFKELNMKHLVFQNSVFMGVFDPDALQDISYLKTINFFGSTLEEIPRLDYFLRNISTLEAVYIEDTSIPNLIFGNTSTLSNLQLLSFKGSGPLSFNSSSFQWLSRSKLKYLNLQDCNINIDANADAVLLPISKTLHYLDLSFTSLNNEESLSKMLHNLSLTHLSLAGLNLLKVPYSALSDTKDTLKYLTFRGNIFHKEPKENMFYMILDFPTMPNLLELDLMNCGINFIETGAFDALPNLRKLYLSLNNIVNINEGWSTIGNPAVRHLDLSWNGLTNSLLPSSSLTITDDDTLAIFKDLTIVDLSHGIFFDPDIFVGSLEGSPHGLSLCDINLKNLGRFSHLNVSELVVLDISSNPEIDFANNSTISFLFSLKSLGYLHARNNKITNNFFSGIKEFMKVVVGSSFIKSLKYMDLSGNNIKYLTEENLRYFPNLNYLDLSANSIYSWDITILPYNSQLRTLKIGDNKLDKITYVMLQDFYKLDEVEIGRNPFICGCDVKTFVNKIQRHSNRTICGVWGVMDVNHYNKRYFVMPKKKRLKREAKPEDMEDLVRIQKILQGNPKRKCISSVLEKKEEPKKENCVIVADWNEGENYYCYFNNSETLTYFTNATNAEDICKEPEMTNIVRKSSSRVYVIYVILSVIIVIAIVGGVIYWKWWDIRLLTRAVRNAAVLTFMDKDEEKTLLPYQYCAFVSYSDRDRPWVLNELLPHLEAWNNLNVCLHERDFQVGTSIMENITSCMDRSKNIVLVLSKSYLKSQWCQFEMHLAQHRLVETKRNSLILILLEPLPPHKKPKILKFLMRTKTYIEWSSNKKEQDNFFSRLFQALSNSDGKLMPV